MAASPKPSLRIRSTFWPSSTSWVLQNGHQSAERKNTSMAPLGPMMDFRVWVRPTWSGAAKSGTPSSTAGPVDELSRVSCFYWGDEASQECAQQARDILANLNRAATVCMSCQVGGVQDVFRGMHTITRTPHDVRGPSDSQVWSQSAHQGGPAVEHDQRAAAVRVQRQVTSGRRPLPVGHLTVQPTVAACSRPERESTSTATQAKNCESLNWGTTRDAHATRSLEPEP